MQAPFEVSMNSAPRTSLGGAMMGSQEHDDSFLSLGQDDQGISSDWDTSLEPEEESILSKLSEADFIQEQRWFKSNSIFTSDDVFFQDVDVKGIDTLIPDSKVLSNDVASNSYVPPPEQPPTKKRNAVDVPGCMERSKRHRRLSSVLSSSFFHGIGGEDELPARDSGIFNPTPSSTPTSVVGKPKLDRSTPRVVSKENLFIPKLHSDHEASSRCRPTAYEQVSGRDLSEAFFGINSFATSLVRSHISQELLHHWDASMGLKRSHSRVMNNSSKSRKKLQKQCEKMFKRLNKRSTSK